MKPVNQPKPIGNAIGDVLKDLGLDKKVKQFNVLEIWPAIVGERIAEVTTAEHISDGKLFVSVRRSTWRNELIFLKQDIIKKINDVMKQELVKDIIFR